MKKLFVSAIVIGLAGIGFFISAQLGRSDTDGTLTVVLVDENGDTILEDSVAFLEGDSMIEILDGAYSIQCGDSSYHPIDCQTLPSFGRVIVTFEQVETDWWNTFIAIYINDEYSQQGIDDIVPTEGTTYRFEYTEVGDQE